MIIINKYSDKELKKMWMEDNNTNIPKVADKFKNKYPEHYQMYFNSDLMLVSYVIKYCNQRIKNEFGFMCQNS